MPSLSYSYSFKSYGSSKSYGLSRSYGSKIVRDHLSVRLWSLQELQLASRATACPREWQQLLDPTSYAIS
ncbi:uncharacterized protein K441DRAFT_659861 [Cenococcum geophilum 1.58]|uniref:uncharacterized protein n=1 Tax=Cenococcum geophilum 1.58 TaxID=794803 RepID=UPI00358F7E8E|nr:hypothetical protein K441DRAFT_659861 [Cenococcum geophilum 1.58]